MQSAFIIFLIYSTNK